VILRASAALAVLGLLAPGSAPADTRSKHVSIHRSKGAIAATLSYDVLRTGDFRDVRLTVVRQGRTVIDRRVCGGQRCNPFEGHVAGGSFALTLRNMWGSREPEALVTMWTGYAHCCFQIEVGLIDDDGKGQVLFHHFGNVPWQGQWHQGRYEFVTGDDRFAYVFDCFACSAFPMQVFAIGTLGHALVDVTRTRPDLVRANAARWWKVWVKHRPQALGFLGAWCADEYLLGDKENCEAVLASSLKHGYLRGAPGWPEDHGFINLLHKKLAAWGYDRG
jgi:hypothetical protein